MRYVAASSAAARLGYCLRAADSILRAAAGMSLRLYSFGIVPHLVTHLRRCSEFCNSGALCGGSYTT